jgi:ATP-dependent DNA ligase
MDDLRDLRRRPRAVQRRLQLGLEGVVAKKLSSRYQPGERGWIKLKNPNYWRRDAEREAMARKHERRARRGACRQGTLLVNLADATR